MPASPLSRRRLLHAALLLAAPWPLAAAARPGQGAHVVVIGAGMAGLSVAWELQQLGFAVSLLEAQARSGGRNWTIRRSTRVADLSQVEQLCDFSAGQYLNAGPWRILPGHRRVLSYAQRLGVALEPLAVEGGELAWRPQGGMDALPRAIAAQLHGGVREQAVVEHLERHGAGVQVQVRQAGRVQQVRADYAVLTLPLNLLASLPWPAPTALRAALQRAEPADAGKFAFELQGAVEHARVVLPQASDWQLHWPEHGQPAQRIVSLYVNGRGLARQFAVAREEQLQVARRLLATGLQDAAASTLAAPLALQWSRIPFQQAAAVRLVDAADALASLRAGLPPLFFAGDGLSALNGWQEGALESAATAVQRLLQHHLARAAG